MQQEVPTTAVPKREHTPESPRELVQTQLAWAPPLDSLIQYLWVGPENLHPNKLSEAVPWWLRSYTLNIAGLMMLGFEGQIIYPGGQILAVIPGLLGSNKLSPWHLMEFSSRIKLKFPIQSLIPLG